MCSPESTTSPVVLPAEYSASTDCGHMKKAGTFRSSKKNFIVSSRFAAEFSGDSAMSIGCSSGSTLSLSW